MLAALATLDELARKESELVPDKLQKTVHHRILFPGIVAIPGYLLYRFARTAATLLPQSQKKTVNCTAFIPADRQSWLLVLWYCQVGQQHCKR